jgi:aspartyl-tRNA(Asn)/glutamyl-tRNA(Gln) amidotransferase subunit A
VTFAMLSLVEAAGQIRTGELSPVELARECLVRIERLNPALNAFITVTPELALEQARQAETEIIAGDWRGPLHGIPIALKDLIDVAGVRTTAASNQFRNRIANEDAAIAARLRRVGAVIVGKTNLHEFAFGGSGLVSAFGPARNPWDTQRITGGSSSGSAAAVAAGMCVAAIGTDTAGSVRIPAALCGVVGHRPSAGVWSARGIVPLAKSFDTAGPVTRAVEDAWVLMQALAEEDATTASTAAQDWEESRGTMARVVIGIAREGFFDGLDAEVAPCVEEALHVFRSLVESVRDVKLKVGSYRTIFNAEIYEYHREMVLQSPELYEPATLARIQSCAGIKAGDVERAQDELTVARREAEKIFDAIEVAVTPTVVVCAPKVSELQAMTASELRTFEVQYLLRNTSPFSVLNWPSVSVPCGFTSEGLPVGLQISARPGADDLALRVAHAYERATEWHKRIPPIAL